MTLIPLKTNPTRRELRQFAGLWLPGFCFALAAVAWFKYLSPLLAGVTVGAGLAVCATGWLRPEWYQPIFVGWMIAVYPLGWVVSHVLLAILYFAVITPIGWILRFAGRDAMNRRFDRKSATYWEPHTSPADDTSYYRQY